MTADIDLARRRAELARLGRQRKRGHDTTEREAAARVEYAEAKIAAFIVRVVAEVRSTCAFIPFSGVCVSLKRARIAWPLVDARRQRSTASCRIRFARSRIASSSSSSCDATARRASMSCR